MGYTPLFSTLTTGTLCGRWPDIGLWPIVLSLADRNGVVDVTPDYLSRVTGLELQAVVDCMDRFCKPDPYSRSDAEGGARLVLLAEHRAWGWRIVNHGLYREKARKAAYDSKRTESGEDAARKRKSREVPTRPDASREVPLSNSNTDLRRERETRAREEATKAQEFARIKAAYPAGTYRGGEWLIAERDIEHHVSQGHPWAEIHAGVDRYAKQCQAKGNIGTQYVLSPAKFFAREPQPKFLEPYPLPAARAGPASTKPTYVPAPTTAELEALEASRAAR